MSECPRVLKGRIVLSFSHVTVFGKTSGVDTLRKELWFINSPRDYHVTKCLLLTLMIIGSLDASVSVSYSRCTRALPSACCLCHRKSLQHVEPVQCMRKVLPCNFHTPHGVAETTCGDASRRTARRGIRVRKNLRLAKSACAVSSSAQEACTSA